MQQSTKISVLIVDDEPLARLGVRQLLADEHDFMVVGEAGDGRSARVAIEKHAPQVIFLDIQMPLVDGFSLVDSIDAANPPDIVFITAYDEHALRAFDAGAADYLLKPIDPERFRKTLGRLRAQLGKEGGTDIDLRLSNLLREFESARSKETANRYLERIAVKDSGRITFVSVSDIDWISSEGNYVQLHTGARTHLLRGTMDSFERKLDPQQFLRLRRSTIARIAQIKELRPAVNGETIVVLKNNTKLSSSRRYRHNLDLLLKD